MDQAELDQERRISIIKSGLESPFWNTYLLPMLVDKGKTALRALATQRGDDDDVKRGRYQAYQDIIDTPLRELEIHQREEAQRAERLENEQRAQARADVGYRGPFVERNEVSDE